MTSSVDFKAALRAGNLAEAFALAMSKAVELNITTWVAFPDDKRRGESTSREPKSGNRLRTRINLIEGAIENEIGDRFIGNGPYKELQEFHEQQVRDANYILENNLQSLQKLFRALAILKQQQLTNSSGKQALFPGEEVKAATTVKLQPEEGLPEKEDLEYPILTLADLEPKEEDNSYDEKSSDSSSRFNNSVIVTAPHNPQEVEKLASVAYEAPQQEVISRRGENWETDELVSESMEEEEDDWEEFSEDTTDTELIEDWGDWMVEEEANSANIPKLESLDLDEKDDWDKCEETSPFTEVASEEEEFDLDLDSIPEVELSDTALEYALDLDGENQSNQENTSQPKPPRDRPKEDNLR